MGFTKLHDPDKVVLIYDHLVPASQQDDTRHFHKGDEFVEKYGLTHVHRSDGICHQLMTEAGYVKPGDIAFGTDSHTTTYGCVGAFSSGIGYTEMASILGTGTMWIKVPETIKVVIEGELPENVMSKDIILRLIVVAILVSSILRGEYENAAICLLVLFLFLLPLFVQKNFGIELPSTLEIIILLFIFAAEILGELKCYFITFHHWDTMLHTTTGFLCAATGFALIDILNRNSRIKFQLSPIYVALVAFCFSMTVGVLWEFFEFGMDRLFQMDMQKDTVVNSITSVMLDPTNSNIPVTIDGITSVQVNGQELGFGGYLDIGLYDTMKDLFVNFIGAVVFSTIGYFYIKHRGHGKLAKAFIPTITDKADGAAPPENTN